jgi:HlyD family secretion protein
MNSRHRPWSIAVLAATLLLTACREDPLQALGTLEYDRVALPAPVAERIVSINVREGQQVAAGARLLTLERTRTRAQTEAARAEAGRQREALTELRAGARSEQIAQARAGLAAAQAAARDANAYYARLRPLSAQRLVAAADVDQARAAASSANAQVRQAQAALDELLNGTRAEDIAQGEAAVRAAEAQAEAEQATLDKLDVVAPRAGRVDSLPYRLGDQAPVGAPLAILLVGDAPYARVYVPEPIRAGVDVGDRVRVFVDGREAALQGRVRMIRSEPVFTPYYALIGDDAARLSYLAEISLGKDAAKLPAGFPVRVEFVSDKTR